MKETVVGAFDAKTHLSELLDRVERGERIRITRRGRPAAQLVPCDPETDTGTLQALLARVREQRGTYKVTAADISKWKKEGRR
jgi:prevent-host-death family protein